jgi:hypothetical protein
VEGGENREIKPLPSLPKFFTSADGISDEN